MARILYIEDYEDNFTFVKRFLVPRGHELFWAKSAESGLEMAFQIKPDLILLDLGLPDADGQTLSTWLRSDPDLQSAPIIALTAWPSEVARHTVEAYGLDGYLCKPFKINELIQLIDKLLGPTRHED